MKFWQKSYLCILIIFLLAFDIGSYVLLRTSYGINQRADMERGISEFSGLEQALSYFFTTYTDKTGSDDIVQIIDSFAYDYSKYGTSIEVFDGETLVYSNAYHLTQKREELEANEPKCVYRKVNDSFLLYVGGPMQYKNFHIVLSRSADYLLTYYADMLNRFEVLTIAVSAALSVMLIFALLYLTSPIRKLHDAVSLFAAGSYDRRALIKGHDEIGELAVNFNHMADTVEKYIERLKNESELREVFINNLTHELKTPIAAIKGYSEFLRDSNCTARDRETAIAYIIEHTARLDMLSVKLMELLQLKSDEFHPVQIDIGELFSRTIRLMRHRTGSANVPIHAECSAKNLYGDPVLLESLLMNLMENSMRAMKENGRIDLRSYLQDGKTVLEVQDNGVGIPQEDIVKITDAFYVVDKSRSRALGGVGLGLSICSQIVKLHGADLHIASAPGSGTTVTVVFTTDLQLGG